MITRCPTCGTMFKVVPDQLRISEGWVRCGECADVFQASEHLQPGPDEDPARGRGPAPAAEPRQDPVEFRASVGTGVVEPAWDPEPAELPHSAPQTGPQDTADDGPERPLPWWARPVVEPAPSRMPEREDDFPRTVHAALPDDFADTGEGGLADGFPGTVQADLSDRFPGTVQDGLANRFARTVQHDGADAPGPSSTGGDSFLPTLHQELPMAAEEGKLPTPVSEFLNRPAAEPELRHMPLPASAPALQRKLRSTPSFPKRPERRSARESGREPEREVQRDVVADPSLQHLSFLRSARRDAYWRDPRRRVLLWMACALLLLALALQWAVRDRDRIAAVAPASEGLLQALCLPFGCEVGPLRQIDAIVIDSSSFRRTAEGRYQLNLTIKNTAQLPVAMPAIELTLTDTQDQPVLRRVLQPADLRAAAVLGAGAEWSGALPLGVDDAGTAARIVGYRVLAFYP